MRKAGLDTIYELAKKNKKIFFIGSDLGHGTLDEFRKHLPNQFSMEGVSESNIIGMASGLAMEGHIVYINTIATFLTRRCFDQITINLGLENVNVRLMASGGGLVYGPLGSTHMALDDIALMRAVPNMTILCPADAVQMTCLIQETENYHGPVYIRIARGGEVIIPFNGEVKIGKCMKIYESENHKIRLCTTGSMAQIALDIAYSLKKIGINVEVLHFPTIVPFDLAGFSANLKELEFLYILEEHFSAGGFFGEISEQLTKLMPINCKVRSFSAGNKFISSYGRQSDLLKELGLDASSIFKVIMNDLKI